MPKGQYERKLRGSYKNRENGENLTKRVLFLSDNEYFKLKELADRKGTTYSKLIREAVDEYLLKNGVK